MLTTSCALCTQTCSREGDILMYKQHYHTMFVWWIPVKYIQSLSDYLSWNCRRHVVSCRLDPPSNMSAANMPTCRQCVTRRVGNMSNAIWAMSWLAQDDIGRHLSQCASFALASQMSCDKVSQHMTKIDSQSRCWRHVDCPPKQGDREWWEGTFPTKVQS